MESKELLENRAIEAAMNGAWEEAISINKKIITTYRDDLGAHLRLGFACLQLNKLPAAKKIFKLALQIQPKNNIAEDHLEKIQILQSKKRKISCNTIKYHPDLFIDLPGKTRTVHLVNEGKKEILAGLNIGEEVVLKEKRRKLEVRSMDDAYIGCLPDDISKRLTYFIKEKSIYTTHIKQIELTDVVVFIREFSKGKKVKQYPSFPSNPHVMLSDIQHAEIGEDGEVKDEDLEPDHTDVEIGEEDWEDLNEEKDLESIVQLEDEDEEE